MSVRSFGNPRASFRSRLGQTGNRASNPFRSIIQATGGATSTPGNGYKYHYFTHPGGSYPLSPSPQSFVVTSGSDTIDVLLVAGGGGGGSDAGGGGGGGGVIEMIAYPVTVGTYSLGIGFGGQQGIGSGQPYTIEDQGKQGGNTTGFGETAIGGGGGGRGQGGSDPSPTRNGLSGGSGGGGGGSYPGSGTQGSGGSASSQPVVFAGATAYGNTGSSGRNLEETGGGGGGAGGGYPGTGDGNQDGAAGRVFSRFASIIPGDPGPGTFSGGGGGGSWSSSAYNAGAGGAGGGAPGGGYPGKADGSVGGNGTNNLGGGGGGGTQANGGNGGHGCIIIRYLA